jgi:hypothetical protein
MAERGDRLMSVLFVFRESGWRGCYLGREIEQVLDRDCAVLSSHMASCCFLYGCSDSFGAPGAKDRQQARRAYSSFESFIRSLPAQGPENKKSASRRGSPVEKLSLAAS